VTAQLRAELLKQRSTRTSLGLLLGLLALVLLAVLLHALSLPADQLAGPSDQVLVFAWGTLGALFAGLLGAIAITGEIRHGTIRPTFLVTPRRGSVVEAKIAASALVGVGFGLIAEALAIAVGSAALAGRGIDIKLDRGDIALLLVGGMSAAALWAVIGVGIGAVLRNQVATLVGICAWLLVVENLLTSFVPDAGKFAPGTAGTAITGENSDALLDPALGALLLAAYAAAAAFGGWIATVRRDVA
jgi:ABC-2 type transport system permease protein